MINLEEEYEEFAFIVSNAPKYQIGDIILIDKTQSHWLVEDICGWEYCFRILDTNNTRRDSISYIDSHKGIEKVA